MRVLVVHNRYSSRMPSGENLAVDDEVRWLRAAGIDVRVHLESNDDLVDPGPVRRVVDGLEAPWSWSAARRLRRAIGEHRPDLVHVHNLFPLMTASTPHAALNAGIPVVWTVHNRRAVCVAGGNFRDGSPCHECRVGWRVPGIVHGCYAGSRAASAVVTGATSIYRHIARRQIDAVAISEHVRQWLVDTAGFEAGRTRVKHNAVDGPGDPMGISPPEEKNDFLFLGRLAANKGVALLLDAWRRTSDPDIRLRIVGDGPLADTVRAAAVADHRITWLGQLPADAATAQIADARAVVVPSVWGEPFGRVAAEALAYGRPVISSGQGALCEIVDGDSGWTTGTDPGALAEALRAASTSSGLVAVKGAAARRRYESAFSPEATSRRLVEIYRDVLACAGTRVAVHGRDPSSPGR
jgi:glycosyltransferase involved in cell wall biosynthesis